MLGHLMGKFYLRMDQEIQVYFMINSDLVGNGRELHYEKRNNFYLFLFILGSCGVVCNKVIGEFAF